jgi:hypothetical protein
MRYKETKLLVFRVSLYYYYFLYLGLKKGRFMNNDPDVHVENREEITGNKPASHDPTPEELIEYTRKIRKAVSNGLFIQYPHHSATEATGYGWHPDTPDGP